MRKKHHWISPQNRIAIVNRARAVDPDGHWLESYRAIANSYDVTLPAVTRIARLAGVPPRRRSERWFPVPPSLREMYVHLVRKTSKSEAQRLLADHMRVRGIEVMP